MSNAASKKKRSKIRFNFVDVLVLAALLFTALVMVAGGVTSEKSGKEMIVTLQMTQRDSAMIFTAGLEADQKTDVYLIEDGERIGYLQQELHAKSGQIVVRIPADVKGSDRTVGNTRFYVGQELDLRLGEIYCRNAVVKDIREVSEGD